MRSKGRMMAGNNRKRPYGMLLLLALGAAVLSVMVLHKLRERRVFGLLLQERDRHLLSLHHLLQKERDNSKELKRKLEDMKAKISSLRTERTKLVNKLMETETRLNTIQKETETALAEKQKQVNALTEKEAQSIKANLQVATLTELLTQKEAEVQELKQHLTNLSPPQNSTTADKNVSTTEIAKDSGKEESAASDEGQLEKSMNFAARKDSKEDRQGIKADATGSMQEEIPKVGQWVKFTTNVDEEVKEENGTNAKQVTEASGDQRQEKLEIYQDSNQSERVKMSHESSTAEVAEQEKESNNIELIGKTGDGETLKPGEGNSTGKEEQGDTKDGKSEKLDISQNASEQQITTSDAKGEQPIVAVGHTSRKKSKSKRRKFVINGIDLDKQNDAHSGNSENDEKQRGKDENTGEGTTFAANQSDMLENSHVIEDLTERVQDGDLDASKVTIEAILPNDGNTSKISRENAVHYLVDDGLGKQYESSNKYELILEGSSNDERPKTSDQENTSGTHGDIERKVVSTNLEQQKYYNTKGTYSDSYQQGESFDETSHDEEGMGAISIDTQSQTNENSQDNEGGQDASNGNTVTLSADANKQGDSGREDGDGTAIGTDTISNPKQSETDNISSTADSNDQKDDQVPVMNV